MRDVRDVRGLPLSLSCEECTHSTGVPYHGIEPLRGASSSFPCHSLILQHEAGLIAKACAVPSAEGRNFPLPTSHFQGPKCPDAIRTRTASPMLYCKGCKRFTVTKRPHHPHRTTVPYPQYLRLRVSASGTSALRGGRRRRGGTGRPRLGPIVPPLSHSPTRARAGLHDDDGRVRVTVL